jgi:hypothetical protein
MRELSMTRWIAQWEDDLQEHYNECIEHGSFSEFYLFMYKEYQKSCEDLNY